ncbi:facilitated trehalose transporter Tret1-like [Cylas formicarius]|uniref:facilitated trehalose transporter Tret1-like n=1 Tax=Cylas formicarius TaxID=197179 RepID=UPI002958BC25|nr:facilitated trehalose transporter Tret1-like [Cylas formicarius]
MFRGAALSIVTGSLVVLSACTGLSSWDLSDYKKLNATYSQLHANIGEFSWIVNLSVGLVLGAVLAGFTVNRVGRKRSLLFLALPLSCSYLTTIFATNVIPLCMSAFVASTVVGGSFTILVIYIGELCPEDYRHVALSFLNVLITLGTFVYHVLIPHLSYSHLNIALLCLEIVTGVTFLIVGSESPYYHVTKRQFNSARVTLRYLRDDDDVDGELDDIKNIVHVKRIDNVWKEIKSKEVKSSNFVVSNLLLFQQFSGVYAVLFYTQTVLQNATSPELSAIIVSAIHLLSSLAIPAVVASYRRKLLLIVSALAMSLSQASLGVYAYLNEHNLEVSRVAFLPLLSLIVYSLAFNVGFGPVPWIMLSEVFPYNVKHGFVALNVGCAWMNKFMSINVYLKLSRSIGFSWYFFLFGTLNLVAGIFAKFVVKEGQVNQASQKHDDL